VELTGYDLKLTSQLRYQVRFIANNLLPPPESNRFQKMRTSGCTECRLQKRLTNISKLRHVMANTENTQIVHAGVEHVPSLTPLFDEYRVWCGQPPDPDGAREFLTQRIRNNESEIFLAIINQQLAGFTQLYPLFSSVSMESIWLLNDLYVANDYRQQKIGSLLLETATQFARELGALRLELEADVTNSTAQAMYESRGWKKNTKYFHYTLSLCE